MACKAHNWCLADRDENAYRIRTRDFCSRCDAVRYGCFAKRTEIDESGQPWESWGPVGQWAYSCPE